MIQSDRESRDALVSFNGLRHQPWMLRDFEVIPTYDRIGEGLVTGVYHIIVSSMWIMVWVLVISYSIFHLTSYELQYLLCMCFNL